MLAVLFYREAECPHETPSGEESTMYVSIHNRNIKKVCNDLISILPDPPLKKEGIKKAPFFKGGLRGI